MESCRLHKKREKKFNFESVVYMTAIKIISPLVPSATHYFSGTKLPSPLSMKCDARRSNPQMNLTADTHANLDLDLFCDASDVLRTSTAMRDQNRVAVSRL